MATPVLVNDRPERRPPAEVTPLLEAGDRLSRDESESRYERMPHLKRGMFRMFLQYGPDQNARVEEGDHS